MTNASERIVNTRIVTDDDTGEFVVKAYTESGRLPIADYYTDDRDDAEETARAMVRGAVEPLPIQERTKRCAVCGVENGKRHTRFDCAERESDAYKDGVGVDCGDPVVEKWDAEAHTAQVQRNLRESRERLHEERECLVTRRSESPCKGFSVAVFDEDGIELGRVSLGARRFVSVRGNLMPSKMRSEVGQAVVECVVEELSDRSGFEEHEDALRQHERDMGLRS